MSRALNDLAPVMLPKAAMLLARLTEQNIMVLITCTGRTQAEQDAAVKAGTSKVAHSRHQDGMAIDIVPYSQYLLYGADKLEWDTHDPIWRKIGETGEALGFRWGGRFHPLNSVGIGWDPGHFEIPATITRGGLEV